MDKTVSDTDMTPEEYMTAVPGCCRLRTWEDHQEILMCWGVANADHDSPNDSWCGMCEFNAEPAGDFARIEWLTERAKQRVWNTLQG